mgnify:FL=1
MKSGIVREELVGAIAYDQRIAKVSVAVSSILNNFDIERNTYSATRLEISQENKDPCKVCYCDSTLGKQQFSSIVFKSFDIKQRYFA